MNLLLYLSAFIFIFSFVLYLIENYFVGREQVKERLGLIREMGLDDQDMLQLPFTRRVIRPFLDFLYRRALRYAPLEIRRAMEKQLTYANYPFGLNINTMVALQLVLGFLLPVLLYIISRGSLPGPQLAVLGLTGFFLLPVMVRFKAARRQVAIGQALPEMLDLLLISVEAGLGFDLAVKRVTDKMSGELSLEMKRFLEEVRLGRPRAEALREMVDRTGVYEIRLFANAVIQAEQRWGNIAGALDAQAKHLRRKRRRDAEENARKAPVKMIIPMVFLIFPALLVVLLAPALIRLIQILGEVF